MDNLGMIEEFTAMNGLGADPRAMAEEEDLPLAPVPRPVNVSGSSWLFNRPVQSSPAPSIYNTYDFSFPTPWTPPPGSQPVIADTYEGPAVSSAAAGGSGPVAQVAAKNIAANSQNVFAPQAGTVRTDPNRLSIASVINTLLGVTAAGVTEVQRQKLAATLVMAQKKKQPVYLPPQVVQKSQVPVGLLVGAGALVAVGVVLYFVLRKKS